METITDIGDQWIRNILNNLENLLRFNLKTSRKVPPGCFKRLFEQYYYSNCFKNLDLFQGILNDCML